MEEFRCGQCRNFRQHYIIDSQKCTAVGCGHCTYPRVKHRKPDSAVCQHFALREQAPDLPDREAVTHFLTEDFLRYVLSLELPPYIE